MNLNRDGKFLAKMVAWRAKQFDSGAVAIGIEFRATDELFGDDWEPMREPATVFGDFWVVGKDGSPNTKTAKRMSAIGWDGTFSSINSPPPEGPVRITVEPENYKGKTTWKVKWVNPLTKDGDAGGESASTADLDAKFGSKLQQALNRKGKPDATPPKPAGVVRKPTDPPVDNDIPF